MAQEPRPIRGPRGAASPACVELLGQAAGGGLWGLMAGAAHGETDAGGATEEDTGGGPWKGTLLGARSWPEALHGGGGTRQRGVWAEGEPEERGGEGFPASFVYPLCFSRCKSGSRC